MCCVSVISPPNLWLEELNMCYSCPLLQFDPNLPYCELSKFDNQVIRSMQPKWMCSSSKTLDLELIRVCVCVCVCANTVWVQGCKCMCMHMHGTTTWLCVCVCVSHSRVAPFFWTTHMPLCSVQWPEWQLRGLGWAAGIVPFMVVTDGASRDARLLQRTGREGGLGRMEGVEMS